ncbi:hypothetical protein SDC9_117823 [bioreactor metagenome]|uniref:Uncharacterized protein n=1 Tax=bioreactor metagenome TaxID=1076179 RepID=A0A645BZT1_9ZZZZ
MGVPPTVSLRLPTMLFQPITRITRKSQALSLKVKRVYWKPLVLLLSMAVKILQERWICPIPVRPLV